MRVWLACLLVAVPTLWAGAVANAVEGDIATVHGGRDGSVKLVFRATGLPPGAILAPASVEVRIDGTPIDGVSAERYADTATPGRRVAVLAIDRSGSMKGAAIAGARRAALAFLDAVPSNVRVGLVTFNREADEVVAPTRDRNAVRTALGDLEAAGGTALYDATRDAVAAAGTRGIRSVLLLSDGEDKHSKSTLGAVAAVVEKSGVFVDVVALGDSRAFTTPLTRIAKSGGGRVIAARQASDLAAAFRAAARTLVTQLAITAPVPAALAGSGAQVTVSADTGATTISDDAFVTLAEVSTPADRVAEGPLAAADPGFVVDDGQLVWAVLALFVGLAGVFGVAGWSAGRVDGQEGRIRRRLSTYSLIGRPTGSAAPGESAAGTTARRVSPVARNAVELAGRVVRRRDLETMLGQRLDAAGVPLRPAEWLLVHVAATTVAGLLGLVLNGGGLLGALVGLVLGAVLPFLYLSMKESRRKTAFLAQLPDTLQLMAGSLAAGYSLPQAIDTVVREGQPPIAGEFNRALVEARLGVPVEDALDGVATRMRSKDFSWVVMAIKIQREVGGNLAELLRIVADTLREREFLRRHVKALSAEGRISAWILGSLPPGFAVVLVFLRRDYIAPMFTELLGLVMLGVGVAMLSIGLLWMRTLIKVEV